MSDTVDVEAFAELGLTYRRLDYWTRHGLLLAAETNPGSGRNRRWPASELDVARVMVMLTAAGCAPDAAEQAARHDGWLAPGVRVVDERGRPICATPRPPEGDGASPLPSSEGTQRDRLPRDPRPPSRGETGSGAGVDGTGASGSAAIS